METFCRITMQPSLFELKLRELIEDLMHGHFFENFIK